MNAGGVNDASVIAMAAAVACEPSWSPTSGAEPGLNGNVNALTTFDDGSVNATDLASCLMRGRTEAVRSMDLD